MSSVMILLIILAAIAGWVVSVYNSLVSKRVQTENGWAQITVQLKRRHDLIPNLVETVKGFAKHEQSTLEKVIQARNAAVSASAANGVPQVSSAESALTGALRGFFALSEAYPELKSNTNFLQLQEELTSTENRISFARQYYNDAVGSYNTAIQQIPGNLIAGFGGFTPKTYFELDQAEHAAVQQPPKVSF